MGKEISCQSSKLRYGRSIFAPCPGSTSSLMFHPLMPRDRRKTSVSQAVLAFTGGDDSVA